MLQSPLLMNTRSGRSSHSWTPDPNMDCKSSRAQQQQQQQTPDKVSPAPKQPPTPSLSMSAPNPPKRRCEASPGPYQNAFPFAWEISFELNLSTPFPT